MSISIHKRNVRDALEPRREPYWAAPVKPGRYIGFRKIDAQRGSWIARARNVEVNGERKAQAYQALKDEHDRPVEDHDAATEAARKWFADLDAGVNPGKKRYTVADACKEYVEDRRTEKGEKTAADAEWRFKNAIYDKKFGDIELSKLRTPALKAWRQSLGMTKAGQNRMMTSLRAALNLAVQSDRVSGDAAKYWSGDEKRLPQYKNADGRRQIFLTVDQRRALLKAAEGEAVRDLIQAALLLGARPGELVAAPRSAFSAREKELQLVGKTGARPVPLDGDALKLFERLAKSKLPAALLLVRDDGEAWTRIEWSRRIRAVAEKAEVLDEDGNKTTLLKLHPEICLYSCRHTYITQAIKDGASVLDVARHTGTSLMMIDRHYGQKDDGRRERMAKVQML